MLFPMIPLRLASTLLYDLLKGSSVKGLKAFHSSDPFPLWLALVDSIDRGADKTCIIRL
jgi:hypothetical protein